MVNQNHSRAGVRQSSGMLPEIRFWQETYCHRLSPSNYFPLHSFQSYLGRYSLRILFKGEIPIV